MGAGQVNLGGLQGQNFSRALTTETLTGNRDGRPRLVERGPRPCNWVREVKGLNVF